MNLLWLYDLPNWQLGLLVVGMTIAFGLGGLYATRRWVAGLHAKTVSNDIVSFFLASVGVFYGITLGLIAVGTWQTFADVESKAALEGACLAALYRDVSYYPQPVRQKLQDELREYTRFVIEEAWPLQRKGIIPEGGGQRMDAVQETLYTFEPTTKGQEKMVNEALHQFNELVQLRRLRLKSVNAGLSGTLWAVVILGALLNLAVTWFFHTASFTLHFWMTILMAALLGILIHLVLAVDHPFLGEYSVGPDAYQLVYDSIMKLKPPS